MPAYEKTRKKHLKYLFINRLNTKILILAATRITGSGIAAGGNLLPPGG
jgi:hypothetical protein